MTTRWTLPSDQQIRDLLSRRLGVETQGVGAVVGVIDPQGRRVIVHGAANLGGARPLDGDSVFEIGSITKVFTALLLTDMAARGEVALEDAVAGYLPAGVTMPLRGGRTITLRDLAMHASGLPRWPDDLDRRTWSNPYAAYTVDQLHHFLSRHEPHDEAGARHLYSNLGFGLLGHALARRAGGDFATLVRQRITGPLRMESTDVSLSPDLTWRLAAGHDEGGHPVANWRMPTFAGAGALHATAHDLLGLLAAALGYDDTPLTASISAQLASRRPGQADYIQALGWRIAPDPAGEIIWHGGATGGDRCFVLFVPTRRAGIVLLMNSATVRNDDIGFHLMAGHPLSAEPSPLRLAPEALEQFVGVYHFSASRRLDITLDGRRLFAQLTDQPRFELFARTAQVFFWRIAKAELEFHVGLAGLVTGLVLRQNGRAYPATREAPPPP